MAHIYWLTGNCGGVARNVVAGLRASNGIVEVGASYASVFQQRAPIDLLILETEIPLYGMNDSGTTVANLGFLGVEPWQMGLVLLQEIRKGRFIPWGFPFRVPVIAYSSNLNSDFINHASIFGINRWVTEVNPGIALLHAVHEVLNE